MKKKQEITTLKIKLSFCPSVHLSVLLLPVGMMIIPLQGKASVVRLRDLGVFRLLGLPFG